MYKFIYFLFIFFIAMENADGQNSRHDPAYTSPGEGWIFVGENEKEVFWIHRPTIIRRANISRAWLISNYRSGYAQCILGNRCYLSTRNLIEANCTERLGRNLVRSTHSHINASGNEIDSSRSVSDWDHIPPNNPYEIILRAMCAR